MIKSERWCIYTRFTFGPFLASPLCSDWFYPSFVVIFKGSRGTALRSDYRKLFYCTYRVWALHLNQMEVRCLRCCECTLLRAVSGRGQVQTSACYYVTVLDILYDSTYYAKKPAVCPVVALQPPLLFYSQCRHFIIPKTTLWVWITHE